MTALGRPPGALLIESLRGAPKDVDPTTAALGYRMRPSTSARWQAGSTPPLTSNRSLGPARLPAVMEPWSVSGGYANYMQADEPIERVRASFGAEAFDRLRALKRQYDPNNVLRRNQNIPPL